MNDQEHLGEYTPYQPDQPYAKLGAFQKAVSEAIVRTGDAPQDTLNDLETSAAALPFDHSNEEYYMLLTVPPEELSDNQRAAVAAHISTCPDCCSVVADFADLPRLLSDLPVPDLPPGLPPKLLQLWDEKDRQRSDTTPD